jgi:DNA-binding response OmpR family regulator
MSAVDYIKKPYDNDDLLNRIGKIIKKGKPSANECVFS